jgi:tetratricopeptide (TPR) repeat protein
LSLPIFNQSNRMTIKGPIMATLQTVNPSGLALLRGFALLCILILLGGCGMGPAMFIGASDREISDATQAVQSTRNDVERARAYSQRGAAYSEKARYSRAFKLIPADEYERLFDLAVKDHDEAVRLNPESAEIYLNRGQAYYDRGSLDLMDKKDGKPWFDLAATNFEKATEKDPKDPHAFDMLGLTHEENGESDKAIRDYTREMALVPFGRQRLADAYCTRGFHLSQEKNYVAAVVEYQKSIEFGAADNDTCPYEPYDMLVVFYSTVGHQYDKAWDLVHEARESGRRIEPETIARLKKNSGRND